MNYAEHFHIQTWADKGENWFVIRKRDHKVVHVGSIYDCCRWVNVWGVMHV